MSRRLPRQAGSAFRYDNCAFRAAAHGVHRVYLCHNIELLLPYRATDPLLDC
jgi:hypothetical protein